WLLEYPLTYPMHRNSALRLRNNEFPISNGAYQIVGAAIGSDITLQKNPYYYDAESTTIESVRYLTTQDQNAVYNRFRAGQVHLTASVPSTRINQAESLADAEFVVSPQLTVYYYALNTTAPPLNNKNVRRALDISIDRVKLVATVLASGQVPAASPVPPYMPGYGRSNRNAFEYGSDRYVQEAAALLAEEGYTVDNRLKIRMLYNTGSDHRRIALYLKATWASSLPVDVELDNVDFRVLLDRHRNKSTWDAVRSSWSADYPDASTFLSIFTSDSPNNIAGTKMPKYDVLIDAAASETEQMTRNKLLVQAEEILEREHANIFLYYYADRRLRSKKITSYVPNSLGIIKTQHLAWTSG
ncbi:MAG: peptide ABC transporter substrate-binding protein, partial [Pseudomonadota bacterium]